MSPYICQICRKSYTRHDSLKRHITARHPERQEGDEQGIEESYVKKTKRYDVLGHLRCHKCGQVFGSQEHLDYHLRKKDHGIKQFPCMYCIRVFPTQEALDNHFHHVHTINEKDLMQCTSTVVFNAPFTMYRVGPSRSGKTTWVGKLLKDRFVQIKPTPSRIIYCYTHWKPMYDELKRLIPEIEWGDGLPTEETFSTFPNSLVILDDMMDGIVNDSKMMKVFTEGSHHQNISVIFMTQNIFHQGKTARTMSLNTQYMVLFKNPRDRQQIKTLARQMYPQEWMTFLEKFRKETDKPYGKLILDLRPNVSEKDRILKDDDCPKTPITLTKQVEGVIQHGEGQGILEMNVEDLKRILPLESSSQLVSNSPVYILILKST
ncbi:MAG: hypothetical protein GY816_17370 [Cytophagales bacterium]|nr:hypothetical protein [Cytophagales bacterium]